jgi:hypothetical protein
MAKLERPTWTRWSRRIQRFGRQFHPATSKPGWDRFNTQWKTVSEAAKQQGLTLEFGWQDGDGKRRGRVPDFVFERGTVLTRSANVDFVMREGGCHLLDKSRNPRGDDAGVLVLGVDRNETTLQAVERINRLWQRNHPGWVVVTPNYLVSICNTALCPADEPVPVPPWPLSGPRPPQRQDHAGEGIRVWVIDTGLIDGGPAGEAGGQDAVYPEQLYPWLAEPGIEPPHGQPDAVLGAHSGMSGEPDLIAEYGGHGTFVAGVLKCVAPGAEVTVKNELKWAGANLEVDLGNALVSLLDQAPKEEQPHIISLSAGATTFKDLQGLLGLDDFMNVLEHSQILLIAAAGNDGSQTKFFPAAYAADRDGVLSVGALREDGKGRACFSNFGDWVNVYAPGERLVNAFGTGTYRYFDHREPRCIYYHNPPLYVPCTCTDRPDRNDERWFDGMAEWSGTSFATPIVAGRVAVYMSEHGTSAFDAAAKLRKQANRILDDADKEPLRVLLPRPMP